MKKWKIFLSALLAATALVACATAIGCKTHKHAFSSDWVTTSTHHWHEATCEHTDEKGSYGEHRWDENWVCRDCEYARSFDGLKITKAKTQYTLTKATVNVPVNDISVTAVDEDGEEVTLAEADYELTFYKGKEKINTMNKLEGGAYNIWVTAEVGGETRESFVMVYVIDNVIDFNRDDSLNDSAREQDLGLDIISDKWNFVVTYSSGRQTTINVSDEHIVRTNFSTFIEADNKPAAVTYTEVNCVGESTTKTLNVSYTIKKNPNSNIIYNNYDYAAITKTLSATEQAASTTPLKQGNLNGNNSFLTIVDGGTVNYRGTDSKLTDTIEIKGNALTVTFDGVGVLMLSARSNSTDAYSSIAVIGEDGEYVLATYQPSKNIGRDDDEYIYSVTGDFNELMFEISKPGTYTIITVEEVLTDGNTIDTNRNTRINKIEMTDILTKEGN